MQRMFDHINAFDELMNQKGYDGYFQSSFGFNDKLKENLIKHTLQCYEEKRNIGPVNLTTYTHWKDNESPYVRCNFYSDFNDRDGFSVTKVNIEYGNQFGVLHHKEIPIGNNSEIPDRSNTNRMIMEQKKGAKI